MKKRLTIELEGDEFRAVMGAILRTGADFKVESIEEPVAPRRQYAAPDGRSAKEILLDEVDKLRKVHTSNLSVLGHDHGFAKSTFSGVAGKLIEEGVLKRDGLYLVAVKEAKQ